MLRDRFSLIPEIFKPSGHTSPTPNVKAKPPGSNVKCRLCVVKSCEIVGPKNQVWYVQSKQLAVGGWIVGLITIIHQVDDTVFPTKLGRITVDI